MGGCLYMLRVGQPAVQKGDRLFTTAIVRCVAPAEHIRRSKLTPEAYGRPAVVNAPAFAGKNPWREPGILHGIANSFGRLCVVIDDRDCDHVTESRAA